ncbi:MAG TPA: Ig-like domain-containing protein [Chloroflexota bacterium]|nr:Ig-like domain-containing protein [Chloroflexota bacterium]
MAFRGTDGAAFAGIALLTVLVGAAVTHAASPSGYTVDLPIVMNRAPINSSPTPTVPPGSTPTPTATTAPGATPTSTATTGPPSFVQSVQPAPGSAGVPAATAITIVFNTTMNQASVQNNMTIAPALYGWSASWQGNTVIFRPSLPLDPNTTYTVTLGTGVTTASLGQAAGLPYTWTFTTGPVVPPAQPILFTRVNAQSGVSDLWVMNPDGSSSAQLTHMPASVLTLTGDGAWAPQGRAIAFDSALDAVISTLDANVFVANADASAARMVTGNSYLGQKPGPTGSVAVTVNAPNLDGCGGNPTGPFTLTAYGTTNVVTNANPGGTYVISGVPAGVGWVRVEGYYGSPPSGPGRVQGSAAVTVTAGQTTPATVNLAPGTLLAGEPVWSPDGSKLAYLAVAYGPGCANGQWGPGGAASVSIHVVAPDGSNDTDVYDAASDPSNGPLTPDSLDWSPDRARIVFGDIQQGIYTINPKGPNTQGAQLVLGGFAAAYQCGAAGYYCSWDDPRFSPDGTKLADVEAVLNLSTGVLDDQLNVLTLAKGTSQTLVSYSTGNQFIGAASWSPDGSQIIYAVRTGGLTPSASDRHNLWIVNADGTGATPITTDGVSSAPAWRR